MGSHVENLVYHRILSHIQGQGREPHRSTPQVSGQSKNTARADEDLETHPVVEPMADSSLSTGQGGEI
jgi:hypothetical protein